MHKILVGLGFTALLIGPIASVAGDQSGWARFGQVLGGGNSESAYLQGLREGLEREALLAEARTRRYVDWVRSQLSGYWQVAGFSPSEATALAAAYEPATSEAAVVASIRRKGAQSAIADIRAALDGNNYLLANQLLLACAVVSVEEQKQAEVTAQREAAEHQETMLRQAQRQTDPEANPPTPQ